ncbi:hypothetical protein OAL71_01465 [Phycisphaerales bacterium]|nr:hypothetical protein [Phycisphaerales bacterium]
MNQHHINITTYSAEGAEALLELLRSRFVADATVVIEASDHVASTTLGALTMPAILDRIDVFGLLDGRPAHATADRASGDLFEGRVVAESDDTGRVCHRLDRQLMCFGEVIEATATTATSAEARVKPFTIPVDGGSPGDQLVARCHDYLAVDDDGQAVRIASIVTGFEAMKKEVVR